MKEEPEAMSIPVYGWVQGDTVVVIVLAHEDHTVRELIEVLCDAAAVRVSSAPRGYASLRGRRLNPDASVRAAGVEPLDRIDVSFE
jgi:hypothetical protein